MYSYTSTRKLYTLIVPIDDGRVLLGYKKRGFGVGKYNGFGGKVEPGETIAEGAIRELEEEAGIKATNLPYHGLLYLESIADPTAPILEIHVFAATSWTGEPMETEEMRPEWYSAYSSLTESPHPPIPFHTMWEESAEWLPSVLGLYFPVGESTKKIPVAEQTQQAQMIHHTTFRGGPNPETGLENIWHSMDGNFVKWLGDGKVDEDGYPGRLEDWTEDIRERWIMERRKGRLDVSGVSGNEKV